MAVSQGSTFWNWLTGLWGGDEGGGGGGGEHLPTGTPALWMENDGLGYYGTGGGSGYIHGGPENDLRAWEIYTQMRRNGWDVHNPFGVDEARRGMGEFTEEERYRYLEDYFRRLQEAESGKSRDPFEPGEGDTISTEDFEPEATPAMPKERKFAEMLEKGMGWLLGKSRPGRWFGLKERWEQGLKDATPQDWLDSLSDKQMRELERWFVGQGADKNWIDRTLYGDAPWSNESDVPHKTGNLGPNYEEPTPRAPERGRQEPREPKKKGKKEGGGGGGGYTGPSGLPTYNGPQFNPYFVAWQPTNKEGPVQFVPGRR